MIEVGGVDRSSDGASRLPGGLSPWRGRLLESSWPYAQPDIYVRALAALFVVLAPLGFYLRFGVWAGGGALVVAGAFICMWAWPLAVPGVRVMRNSQPALAQLVADVARQASLRSPDRVWLTRDGQIRARVFLRRRELLIGEALLVCLSRPQTAALVAHELTTLDYPRPGLVVRLLRIWADAPDVIDITDPAYVRNRRLRSLRRTAQRLISQLTPLGTAVHQRADAAAIACGGDATTAASAFAQELAVGYEFFNFPFQGPGGRPDKVPALTDLIDGWCRWLTYGVQLSATGPGWEPGCVDELSRTHANLLSALVPFATVAVTPTLAADAVPLTPQERRPRHGHGARWTTFAEVNPEVWISRAAADVRALRRRAAQRLGRSVNDDLELVTMLLTWEVDDAEAETVPGVVRGSDPIAAAPPGVGYVLEDRLLSRGYRLEHPALRGVLVGPDGQRIDARHLVGGTYVQPELSKLRRVLDAADARV